MTEAAVRKLEPEAGPVKPEIKRPKEITIELLFPVQAHGEMVKKLTFRRPTGGDLMSLGEGYPIIINFTDAEMRPNPAVMGEMMALLAMVPPSTIKSLDSEDFATCAFALMSFFPPGVQAMQF
jgi:hypothetical protein